MEHIKVVDKPLRSYILILDWVDTGHAVNTAAHAGSMLVLKWGHTPETQEWLRDSFRKVTCKVTPEQFEHAKKYDNFLVVTELAFENKEVALVFAPRREYPKFFKFLDLYK